MRHNIGHSNEDDIRVIFDQWQKLHLGLDALSNQKILKGIYCLDSLLLFIMARDSHKINLRFQKAKCPSWVRL